ncbi:MAG: hypothetical protein SVW02_00690 [Candidatus Nanohaloarchaea archaeon]|nr:hypothetical protein [Candidatus Nanohaloarchaea archaeon]
MLYTLWIFGLLVAAAARDLRTGQVEDVFPGTIALSGVTHHLVLSAASGSWFPVFVSIAVGLVCTAIGVYTARKELWGEADALLLGAVGFAFPEFQAFLIGAVGATWIAYVYAWKYVTGEDVAHVVPAFPVAVLILHVLLG